MSYLEEWNRIEQMIESNNISKSTTVTSEKVQALASMHIAKCLSVYADEVANAQNNVESIRRCGECVHQGDTEHCASCQIIFNVTGFEKREVRPCNNCIHSNDEYELNCSVCDEKHNEYKPFGFRGKDDEIEVTCPICTRIITVRKTSDKLLHLLCPTCSAKFTYNVNTHNYESYID